MNVHDLLRPFLKYFRSRRMRRFQSILSPSDQTSVIDVGGSPFNWQYLDTSPTIVLLNITSRGLNASDRRFPQILGDGRNMGFRDGAFEIAFSNSVIEHVGDWTDQRAFAREICRVGKQV